jgi:hypothetical protein
MNGARAQVRQPDRIAEAYQELQEFVRRLQLKKPIRQISGLELNIGAAPTRSMKCKCSFK